MQLWIGLVAGILIGWIIEWVIDWLFWRRTTEASFAEEAELRRQLQAAEAEIAHLRRQLEEAGIVVESTVIAPHTDPDTDQPDSNQEASPTNGD